MQNIYGVLDSNGCHIDVSLSEKAAKRYATMRGYNRVSIRYACGYHVAIIAVKDAKGKWIRESN